MPDNFITEYLSQAPPEKEAKALMPSGERNFIQDYLHPEGEITEAAAKERLPVDELAARLSKVNRPMSAELRKAYTLQQKLDKRRDEYNEQGVGAVQAYKQFFQPFGDVVTLVPFGDRSVGTREYQKAQERFTKGEASDDDIDAIATYEALQNARGNLDKAGVGGKIVGVAGDLGKIIPELMTGESALAGAAKIYQTARGVKAAKDASRLIVAGGEGGAVEASITPSLLSRGTQFTGKQAALTAMSPSMYVPMAQQINMRENRPANDIRGYPTAYGYGVATNLAIGHMRTPDKGSFLATVAKKGGTAALEMSLIEDAARLMDEVIPKGYQIGSEGSNVSKVFRGIREGKDDAIKEGLEHSFAQVVAFGLFGAFHREPGAGPERRTDSAVRAWDEAVTKLKERGITEKDAGISIERINSVIEGELSRNPYLDRAGIRKEVIDKIKDPTIKEYADKIVEATIPDKSYGRMHDEVSRWLDENRPPTSQDRVTLRERERSQPYNLFRSLNEKPPVEKAGAPPRQLPDPALGAEAESLFARLTSEGVSPQEAGIIASRVYEQSVANKAKEAKKKSAEEKKAARAKKAGEAPEPDKKASGIPTPEGKAEPKTEEVAKENPKEAEKEAPKETLNFDSFDDISYGDLRRVAKQLGIATSFGAGGKMMNRVNIAKAIADLGLSRPQVDAALAKANEVATVASPTPEAKDVPKAGDKPRKFSTDLPKAPETPTVPERKEAASASPERADKVESQSRPSEPEISQPEATGKQTEHQVAESRILAEIDADSSLSASQKYTYSRAVSDTLATMPEAAVRLINSNLKKTKFYQTPADASIAAIEDQIKYHKDNATGGDLSAIEKELAAEKELKRQGLRASAAARYTVETGTIHSDGDIPSGREPGRYPAAPVEGGMYPARAIWAHEATHAIDHKFKLSTHKDWTLAWLREIKNQPGQTPTLTEYGGEFQSEGFAEFGRILYASDIPTAQIARDFPKASKFFKDNGLWPAERGGPEKKAEEIFDKRIGTDANHTDMKSSPDAPVVATVAKEPSAPEVSKTEPKKSPVAAPDAKLSEKRPNADRKYIESVREGKDADTIEAIDSVLHNMAGEGDAPKVTTRAGLFDSTRRMNTLDNLASTADQLARGGKSDTTAYKTLVSLFRDLGGSQSGPKPGQVGRFDGRLYESDKPAFTGDRVEIITQPMIATDHVTGVDRVLVKGKTQPATVASVKAHRLQELLSTWESLRPSERKKYPELGAEIRELGGDPDVSTKIKRGREEQQVLNPFVERTLQNALDSEALTAQEHRILEKRLRNLTLEQASIGEGKAGENLTRSRVNQIEKAAWEKLRKASPEVFGEHASLEDFIKAEGPNLWRTPSGLSVPRLSEIGEGIKAGAQYDSSIRKFLRRWLTAAGGLTDPIFAAKIARDGRIQSKVQDVRNAEKDLGKVLGGFEGVDSSLAKTLNDALTDTPAGLAAKAQIRNTMENGDRIMQVLDRMRTDIDSLSRELLDQGVIQGDLATVVEANLGMYLTRSYQVFNDPKWMNKVPEDVKNRFISWLRSEMTAERKGITPSESELQGVMESLLVNGTAAESPLAFIAQSKLGSKDLSILKARKDVPPELRALWGEVKDPLANYAATVARMTMLLENHKFLSQVRDEGLGKNFFAEKDLGKFKEQYPDEKPYQIAPEGSKSMGPLAGLYTTKGLKEAFERSVSPETLPWYLQHYMKLLSATKYAKTIGSWVTHFRNFTSNAGFAIANGHFRAGNFPEAMRLMREDTPAARTEWKKLIELGVVGDNIHASEFRDVVNDALGVNSPFFGTRMQVAAEKGLLKWLKKGFDVSQKLYNAEDAVWKVYAFKNEVSRYKQAYPEWTQAQVEAKAAEIVRNTYPTYSMVSPAVRAMRRFPLTGSFVSFPAEVIRTTYHTVRQAMTEIADPATRQIGYTRLSGLITSGIMSASLSAATAAMFGISQEDDRDMRRFMPEWSKNSLFLHLGKDSQGRYKYVDLSRNDPHAYLSEAVISALRSDSIDEAALSAASAVARPFVEEEIGTRSILDIARNTKEEGGQVYNPQAPLSARAGAVGSHLAQPLVPGSFSSARKLAMGVAGAKEQKTGIEYDPAEEVAANFGLRISPLDPSRSLTFRAKSYTKGMTQAANMVTLMLRASGDVSPEDLATVASDTDKARRAIFDEFRQDVLAAERLGMTKQEIRKQLDAAGVSKDEIGRVMNNNYQPFKPDLKGANKDYRERAMMVRQR